MKRVTEAGLGGELPPGFQSKPIFNDEETPWPESKPLKPNR